MNMVKELNKIIRKHLNGIRNQLMAGMKCRKISRGFFSLGQNNLGDCYKNGFGVCKDYKKTFKWYSKSANNECAEGQNKLGECYDHGRGIMQDYTEAFK